MKILVSLFSGREQRTLSIMLLHCIVVVSFLCLLSVGNSVQLRAQSIKWEIVPSVSSSEGNPVMQMGVSNSGTLFASLQSNEMRTSTDNGQNWQSVELPIGLTSAYVLDIVAIGNTLYLCTTSGLWVSADDGATWAPQSGLPLGTVVHSFWKTSSNTLLVGTSSQGILRSTDGGKQWTTLVAGATVQAITEIADNALFAAVDYPGDFESGEMTSDSSGVYSSTDDGATWQKTILQGKFVRTLTGLSNGVLVAGTQEIEGKGRVYRSADGGATWNTTPLQDIVSGFTPLSNGSVVASAFNSGIYFSEDGGQSWTVNNSGLLDSRIIGIVWHPSGYLFAHDVFGTVYKSPKAITSVPAATEQTPLVRFFPSRTGEMIAVFALREQQHIRCAMYDAVGRNVHVLVDEFFPAGVHTRYFSTGSFVAGAYFYRVETSARPVTGTLVLGR